jgi:EAL domain-containing protein (putative c-di-GMP-specific phosphodiesterase class I)
MMPRFKPKSKLREMPQKHIQLQLYKLALSSLNRLTKLGIKISIDDFGSGYLSLSYLKSLPASEIKLDRSLILDITTEVNSRVIVKAAIDIAHGLGYQVVAEGVEDEKSYR